MAQINLKDKIINTIGKLPSIGSQSPNFQLTKTDLNDVELSTFTGKNIILNIFPCIDTPTCATSVRHFNSAISKLKNTVILCVSIDMPAALARFCGSESLQNVIPLSAFRSNFGYDYGVTITDGKLKGMLSRAIVIIDTTGKIIYTEQVPNIADQPNYAAALNTLI